ncbi:MAG TPA: hypothetical protein VGW75_03850 [Solirubrobacteraceae bacterium]|jgi:hypothetical protein|nr:hypothetical protein [Solirubrobacteraceae bacterium]
MRSLLRPTIAAVLAALALPSAAALAHELFDHPAPVFRAQPAPSRAIASGGQNATWEFVTSIPTGNPHSDLDFFTRDGDVYAAVGTLAIGPNAGGQTIVKLTDDGEVRPSFVASHPSAACISNPNAALGLQHDVEATPKGGTILNTFNPVAAGGDAQVIVDATDQRGRCHDQGTLGLSAAPRGGLEIVDVTNPAAPKEIGLTSHVGEAHTVNIDPKRPHIAYAVTSDTVSVNTSGQRENEIAGDDDQFDLDGFEVVDLSSCLNLPADMPLQAKRDACNPQVFRYRFDLAMEMPHTVKSAVNGCHELEIYPNDLLTCAGIGAMPVFDMSGAFDDRGTPDDYTDDKPRGTPLPCNRRRSSSQGAFATGAAVIDCVDGGPGGSVSLAIPNWLSIGAPSLAGVRHVGTVFHQGRGGPRDSTQDIDVNHEAEYTQSGNFILATDERGGGVTPPGASCTQVSDNRSGNGGIHAFRPDRLLAATPPGPAETDAAYARDSKGNKAIYRAPVRTGAQATVCTAHVFQQIPGQNRIFMGWYSQGTQVVDFTENPDGTIDFKEAAWFVPADANEWVSHVFKAQENPDGTFTYWGATGDFNLGERGRNAIDVYRVTLPAPPKPASGPGLLPRRGADGGGQGAGGTQGGAPPCVPARSFRSAAVRRAGRRLTFSFRADAPVTIDLFQQARGGRVTGERLIRRFRNVSGTVRWNGRDRRGRRLTDGYYLVRFAARTSAGIPDERRFGLLRRNGRFRILHRHERRDTCGLLRRWKLYRPVFGGVTGRPLVISFRFGAEATAGIVVRRAGGRVVRRFAARRYAGGVLHRRRLNRNLVRRLPRGQYTVTITVRDGSRTIRSTLRATRV